MIYFSEYETVIAGVSFLILGCLFGGLYNSFDSLFMFLKGILYSPRSAHLRYKNTTKTQDKTKQNTCNRAFKNLWDFIFVTIFGTVCILAFYLFLDGTFRFFALFFLFVGYVFSFKSLSLFFRVSLNKIIEFLLRVFEEISFVLLYPIFYTWDIIKKLLKPIIIVIARYYHKKKFEAFVKKKKREIKISV